MIKEEISKIEITQFNYTLPDERIARFPVSPRDSSKLLIYKNHQISETKFNQLPKEIAPGTLMVFNNTKVIHARLHFRKESGALIEIFCLDPYSPSHYLLSFDATNQCSWHCMVGNSKKWKEGPLTLSVNIAGEKITLSASRQDANSNIITFKWDNPHITFATLLDAVGELPIPPYLNRETEESDQKDYQTVYAKIEGSVAAPTAGLHFTETVLQEMKEKGIECGEVTLHVGAGTFKPVKSKTIKGHEMHTEYFVVTRTFLQTLLTSLGKVIAVGTTSVRTLESLYHMGVMVHNNPHIPLEELHVTQWQPYEESPQNITPQTAIKALIEYLQQLKLTELISSTQILIAPGYTFRIVHAIVTNFHQPQSTLLLLVSAFVGGNWQEIYQYAMAHNFRFLSYGDSSLLYYHSKNDRENG